MPNVARAPMRLLRGGAAGLAGVGLVTAVIVPVRSEVTSATPALTLVLPCVLAALVGGRLAALGAAALAAGVFNVLFLKPYGTIKVDSVDDAIAFAVFAIVAFTVATLVARESERRRAADQRRVEVELLWRENELMQAEQNRLEAATRALEAIDAQRSALLRSVSHDLRTPLAAIRAVVSDLRYGITYEESTREDLLELVADETERLDRLVHNLLSMSRIEAGSLQPELQAVPIDELLAVRVNRLAGLLRTTTVTVDARPDLPLVSADYSMVEQVVTNLLENAVRHTPPGSGVAVSARADGDHIEVAVADDGPGIDPADVPRLFQPFERGSGSRSSGLGLAICKALVEAHGGTITVDVNHDGANHDGPPRGARFAFTLPVHRG